MFSPHYQEVAGIPQEQQPRRTAYHTADQKIRLRPIWKALAVLPPNLLLLGYLILPVAFEGPEAKLRVDKIGIITAAFALIAVAHIISLVLALGQYENRSFSIQSVYIPCLYSNLLGLFNVVFNIVCRDLFPLNSLEIVGMSLPSAFGFVYALAALWTYGRGVSEEAQLASDDAIALLTEEERQRRQLLALLEQGRNGGNSPTPKTMQKTFRVDAPERLNLGNNDWGRYKSTPPPRDGIRYE